MYFLWIEFNIILIVNKLRSNILSPAHRSEKVTKLRSIIGSPPQTWLQVVQISDWNLSTKIISISFSNSGMGYPSIKYKWWRVLVIRGSRVVKDFNNYKAPTHWLVLIWVSVRAMNYYHYSACVYLGASVGNYGANVCARSARKWVLGYWIYSISYHHGILHCCNYVHQQ